MSVSWVYMAPTHIVELAVRMTYFEVYKVGNIIASAPSNNLVISFFVVVEVQVTFQNQSFVLIMSAPIVTSTPRLYISATLPHCEANPVV